MTVYTPDVTKVVQWLSSRSERARGRRCRGAGASGCATQCRRARNSIRKNRPVLASKQAVADIEISFSTDQEVGELGMAVCKKLESKDNGSVRRIFERDDAERCFS